MKKATVAIFLAAAVLCFTNPSAALADEQRLEKWTDEKKADMPKVEQENGKNEILYHKDGKKRWRIFGRVGYRFDSNVRLQSNKSFIRKRSNDQNAGRYMGNIGLSYSVYKDKIYNVDLSYKYSASFHDDSLNEFNYQQNRLALYGKRKSTLWDRPSYVSAQYVFAHGLLDTDTHSSSNGLNFAWMGEWRENWKLTLYNRHAWKNFRNKGRINGDTERDGYYFRIGFLQRYLFEAYDRNNEVNFGYEWSFNATEGNRFDRYGNGVRIGFKTRLIEKIYFETNLFFQDRYFHHFPGSPDRHDLHWKHEYILKRDLNKNMQLRAFYKRTDVNNTHDGVLGRFNYDRNIYGFELRFSY